MPLVITRIDINVMKITFKHKVVGIPVNNTAWDAKFQSSCMDRLLVPFLKDVIVELSNNGVSAYVQ